MPPRKVVKAAKALLAKGEEKEALQKLDSVSLHEAEMVRSPCLPEDLLPCCLVVGARIHVVFLMMDLVCRRCLTNLTFELLPPITPLQPAIQRQSCSCCDADISRVWRCRLAYMGSTLM